MRVPSVGTVHVPRRNQVYMLQGDGSGRRLLHGDDARVRHWRSGEYSRFRHDLTPGLVPFRPPEPRGLRSRLRDDLHHARTGAGEGDRCRSRLQDRLRKSREAVRENHRLQHEVFGTKRVCVAN